MNLRTALDELVDNVQGLTSDEKGISLYIINSTFLLVAIIADPEEFLNLLFKHVLHVEPFLHIRLVHVCTVPSVAKCL